jgi:tRNA (adenine58-N1)-methyltransferase non-catalytic subunit
VGNNNREIFEIEEAQRLQAGDIERMKKELQPSEIISGLVENNEQFSKRTEYSKQKYLRKKERKYLFRIHAQPVTLDALHHYYFAQEHRAVGSIRWEMLALLLLYASPFQKVLLAEQTKGILLAAALTRGAHSVTVAHPPEKKKALKNYPIVEQLNLPAETQERAAFASWE